MPRRLIFMLIATTIFWSSSFAFIKVVVDNVSPAVMTVTRCALGAMVLWAAVFLMDRHERRQGIDRTPPDGEHHSVLTTHAGYAFNGLLTGVPFFLIGWAEQRIPSGIAGIVNASVPVWAAALAMRWDTAHRTTPIRWLGVMVGFAGVVFLIVSSGLDSGARDLATTGLLASALGAMMYGVGGVFVSHRLSWVLPARVAAWACTWGAAILLVPALPTAPTTMPDPGVLASLAVLGFAATGFGFLFYYTMLSELGATRASMVTYLLPPLALIYGAIFFNEPFNPIAIAAMALILLGVFIGSRGGTSGGTPTSITAPMAECDGSGRRQQAAILPE